MPDLRLSQGEAEVLKLVLGTVVVRARTGEVGIVHGANRFVSTNVCLRKPQKEALGQAAAKLGLRGVPEVA